MESHRFIFSPGEWLGTGTIKFTQSPDTLRYHTRWEVEERENTNINIRQTVEIEGVAEHVINQYELAVDDPSNFKIQLSNQMVGSVTGNGLVDENLVSWEFRGEEQEFEGFEIYEKTGDDSYKMKGEFTSDDESRTYIEGKIWLRTSE